MKKKNIQWNLLTMIVVGMLSVSMISCGDDDRDDPSSGGGGNVLARKLMSHKWYHSDMGVNDYSYGWSVETNTSTIFFLDESTGVEYWTFNDKDTDLGTTKNSGISYFSYEVNGTEISMHFENGRRSKFTDYGNYIGESDDATDWYEAQSLTSYDLSRMGEWRDAKGYEDAVEKYVHGVFTKVDEFELNLNITSTLDSYYPSKKIKYMVVVYEYTKRYGRSESDTYTFTDNKKLFVKDLYSCVNANFDDCYVRYKELQQKIAEGKVLTSYEKEELDGLIPILKEIKDNIDFEVFVEIQGNRYKIGCDWK